MLNKLLTLHKCTSLKFRIILHTILMAFIAIGVTYFVTYNSLEKELENTYFDKLTAIREIKKTQVQKYFNEVETDISLLAQSPDTIQSTKALSKSFKQDTFQSLVNKYDIVFKNYIDKKHFYDLFLIDIKSNDIIYTVKKESDFATNIITGDCAHTHLNTLYKNIKKHKGNTVQITDFKHYMPSNDDPAAFIGTKIYDKHNKPIAILILQISIKKINNIMTGSHNWVAEGFGRTGESYIISDDCTMRNDSRFFIENEKKYFKQIKHSGLDIKVIEAMKKHHTTVLFQEVKGNICNEILQGKSGTKILRDYRGVEILRAYAPLKIDGLHWVIVSDIDKVEAFKYLNNLQDNILFILILIFTLMIFITIAFATTITKPLYILKNAVKNLGTGDLSKRVDIACRDEIGDLADSFNNSLEKLEHMTHSAQYFSELSVTDNLTQIYNRTKLNDVLDDEIKRFKRAPSSLSLVMFDIDHFKKINDTFGHDVGDTTLTDLVDLVNNTIRETDIFVRWGGEEFILLLIDTNIDHAKYVSEKIRMKIEKNTFKVIKTLTCSFGVTQLQTKDTKESVIKRLDEALYAAKHSGRNKVETKI